MDEDLFGDRLPPDSRRGRGATTNLAGRFEALSRHVADDGWATEDPRAAVTRLVAEDASRSVITRNRSPDVPFDRSINPYRGCEHGCIYCFARPSHAYLGLSPGLDFETRLMAKPDAPRLLEEELRAPSYRPATLAIGTNTDPYQPIEGERRIMRGILEVLSAYNHPVAIVTKGALVTRDADILGDMGRRGLARVMISLTSLDTGLSRRMEPRAAAPTVRLRAITALTRAGCPTGVMLAPLIPGLNDHEIEALVAAAAGAGAVSALHIVLRLPREVRDLFVDWLAETYPDRAARVMRQVREIHGGQDYDPAWGKRMSGEGVIARLMARRVQAAVARAGIGGRRPPLRSDLFAPPPRAGDQLSLAL